MKTYDFSRVLTTGAQGMIGSYVDFGIRPSSKELDILDRDGVERFVQEKKPTAIIHLAGATDMERCERDPSYALSLNAIGTYNIARAAKQVGAVFVYISTSRVFDGEKEAPYTEADEPDPQGNYAFSKYLGETIVQKLVPQHCIVRTCWVFGGGPERDNKFYGKILRQLGQGEIKALNDVHGSPTYAKDLIEAVKQLLEGGRYGTFHISNAGSATRYDIVQKIVEQLKPSVKVVGVNRSDLNASSLPKNESITSTYVTLRPWEDALTEYVEKEWRNYLTKEKLI